MHILMSLIVGASAARGSMSSYPPQAISATGVARIEISGVRGAVKLTGRASARYRLKVRHTTLHRDDWGLSVERRGDCLAIEVYNTALGREWKPILARDQWPVFDVELEGPAHPAVVGWRDGAIDVEGWSAPVDASLLTGAVRVRRAGDVRLRVGGGDVTVADASGSVDVRGGAGALRLDRVTGPSHLNWFSGSVDLVDVRGSVEFEGERAHLRAAGGRGAWTVRPGDGSVATTDFAGRLRGTGRAAAWRVHANETAEIRIDSERGPVTIFGPTAGHVSLGSRAGSIRAPWTQVLRDGVRVAEGRLGATVARKLARIFVRTNTGSVRLAR